MSGMNNFLRKPYVLLGLGAALAVGVFASTYWQPKLPTFTSRPIDLTPAATVEIESSAAIATLHQLDVAFQEISEAISEAVVHISARDARGAGGDGSGFIISPDGWIVTNDHVVRGRSTVTVILNDGREIEGEVKSVNDAQLDLALVKIDSRNLPTLKFADSNDVRPGQFAIAIGAPFGLENTVTVGHVSAIARTGQVFDSVNRQAVPYFGLIQTDAAINPGNSGGPLVNLHGHVIGINTAIYSTTGASAGIGFAIPSNVAQVVADEMIRTGEFKRGFLGVLPRDLKKFEQRELGLNGGAMISFEGVSDREETSAWQAGLRDNDVIVEFDGRPVRSELDLRVGAFRRAPGDEVEVKYVRNGSTRSTKLKLAAPEVVVAQQTPPQQQTPRVPERFEGFPWPEELMPQQPPTPSGPTLGVQIELLDQTNRGQYNMPSDVTGVVIVLVAPDSLAERSGLRTGDVVTAIDGEAVRTVRDLQQAVQRSRSGTTLRLTVKRFVDGNVEDREVSVTF